MPTTHTPLRYPGGKSSITPMITEIINHNKLQKGSYAEPYAGGCGLALALLFKGHVHELHLNDIDPGIWAFWNATINDTNNLIDKIKETQITIDEWHRQREVQLRKDTSRLDLAFSTLFLNRTSRSGIILKSGVIGGLKQAGNYKLDCRFNKETLIKKIQRIAKYKHRIHFYNLDAIDFIHQLDTELPHNSLFCIDPPYYEKGATLYTNFYEHHNHVAVSDSIKSMKRNWILTYDNAAEIKNLYKKHKQYSFHLSYSAAEKRVGTELLIISKKLKIPSSINIQPIR